MKCGDILFLRAKRDQVASPGRCVLRQKQDSRVIRDLGLVADDSRAKGKGMVSFL